MFNLNGDTKKPLRVALYARGREEGDDHEQKS